MKLKSVLVIMLVLALCVIFAGCSSEEEDVSGIIDDSTMSIDEKIEKVTNTTLGEERGGQKTFIKSETIGVEANKKVVHINDGSNYKYGMLENAARVLQNVFKINNLQSVTLFIHGSLEDKYGNSKDEEMMKIILSKETANKINWENFDASNFPEVADEYWEHLELKKE